MYVGGWRVGEGKGGKAKRRRRLWGRGRGGVGWFGEYVALLFFLKWKVCARRRRGVFFTDDFFLCTVEVRFWEGVRGGGGGIGAELRGIGENGFEDS